MGYDGIVLLFTASVVGWVDVEGVGLGGGGAGYEGVSRGSECVELWTASVVLVLKTTEVVWPGGGKLSTG